MDVLFVLTQTVHKFHHVVASFALAVLKMESCWIAKSDHFTFQFAKVFIVHFLFANCDLLCVAERLWHPFFRITLLILLVQCSTWQFLISSRILNEERFESVLDFNTWRLSLHFGIIVGFVDVVILISLLVYQLLQELWLELLAWHFNIINFNNLVWIS